MSERERIKERGRKKKQKKDREKEKCFTYKNIFPMDSNLACEKKKNLMQFGSIILFVSISLNRHWKMFISMPQQNKKKTNSILILN